jgi:hypothetical protein
MPYDVLGGCDFMLRFFSLFTGFAMQLLHIIDFPFHPGSFLVVPIQPILRGSIEQHRLQDLFPHFFRGCQVLDAFFQLAADLIRPFYNRAGALLGSRKLHLGVSQGNSRRR